MLSSGTVSWTTKGGTPEFHSRPTPKRNISKIIAISRPFNNASSVPLYGKTNNNLKNMEHAKFLFMSLNEENATSTGSVTTRSSLSRDPTVTVKSTFMVPKKPQGVMSPGRIRSEKKCRILTVSSRKSVSPAQIKNEVTVETKLKLSQCRVAQLSKIVEEKDCEIERLKKELLWTKAEYVKATNKALPNPPPEFDCGGDLNAKKSRSISNLKANLADSSRRGSACALHTYWPGSVKRLRKATLSRAALESAKQERDSLTKEMSGWGSNPNNDSLKMSARDTISVMGHHFRTINPHDDENMEIMNEKLKSIKDKVADRLKEAKQTIYSLRKFIKEHIQTQGQSNKEVLAITDSDLL